jgi:carbamate kinase
VRIVIALGGNALLERGEPAEAPIQQGHVRQAAQALAPLIAEHEVIICHGNGPQAGILAAESESDPALSLPYPLDVIGAQTQGMIGYWLVRELHNAGAAKPVVAVITQAVVNAADPAFAAPTKFIGPGYEHARAQALAGRRGWRMSQDGRAWRRVVPSPEPERLVELPVIRMLLAQGIVVVCGGGGGVPVVAARDTGRLTGVSAVVDKDLTAALIAARLKADRFLVLTDVPAVMRDWGTPAAAPIDTLDLAALHSMRFPAGSMGPKIEACARFVRATGRPAAIGSLRDAAALLNGTAGTTITPVPAPARLS